MDFLVLDRTELPIVDGVSVLEGLRHNDTRISIIFVDLPPGSGPRLHQHPYKEIFIIHTGRARFTVGKTSMDIEAGQVVAVAADIPHKFVNSGKGKLVQTDIHLSPTFRTEWLEQ